MADLGEDLLKMNERLADWEVEMLAQMFDWEEAGDDVQMRIPDASKKFNRSGREIQDVLSMKQMMITQTQMGMLNQHGGQGASAATKQMVFQKFMQAVAKDKADLRSRARRIRERKHAQQAAAEAAKPVLSAPASSSGSSAASGTACPGVDEDVIGFVKDTSCAACGAPDAKEWYTCPLCEEKEAERRAAIAKPEGAWLKGSERPWRFRVCSRECQKKHWKEHKKYSPHTAMVPPGVTPEWKLRQQAYQREQVQRRADRQQKLWSLMGMGKDGEIDESKAKSMGQGDVDALMELVKGMKNDPVTGELCSDSDGDY